MTENTNELKGDDWLGKLQNPQGKTLDTETAEGLGSSQQTEQNVDPQQQ
jgi:hypothetical protein